MNNLYGFIISKCITTNDLIDLILNSLKHDIELSKLAFKQLIHNRIEEYKEINNVSDNVVDGILKIKQNKGKHSSLHRYNGLDGVIEHLFNILCIENNPTFDKLNIQSYFRVRQLLTFKHEYYIK